MDAEPRLYDLIYSVIRQIPTGKVATYGQISRIVGRCSAQMIGFALPKGISVRMATGLAPTCSASYWKKKGSPLASRVKLILKNLVGMVSHMEIQRPARNRIKYDWCDCGRYYWIGL